MKRYPDSSILDHRSFQWSDLKLATSLFSHRHLDASKATPWPITDTTSTVPMLYMQLKETQRMQLGNQTILLQITDAAVHGSAMSVFLAAFHVFLDHSTVNIEPVDVPCLKYVVSEAGMKPLLWLWNMLEIENSCDELQMVHVTHLTAICMWFANMWLDPPAFHHTSVPHFEPRTKVYFT